MKTTPQTLHTLRKQQLIQLPIDKDGNIVFSSSKRLRHGTHGAFGHSHSTGLVGGTAHLGARGPRPSTFSKQQRVSHS